MCLYMNMSAVKEDPTDIHPALQMTMANDSLMRNEGPIDGAVVFEEINWTAAICLLSESQQNLKVDCSH